MDRTEQNDEQTKPALTGKETFSRRGFKSSEEVLAEPVASANETTESVEPEQPALADEISFEEPGQNPGDEGETVQAPVEAQAAEDVIRIGDKTFKTQKEAWAYAEELDRQNLANDAFRQGIEAASLNQNSYTPSQPAPQPEEYKIPDEYYTNPAKFFKEQEIKTAQRVQAAIDARINQISTHEQTMNKFWSDYPDLAKNQATRAIAQQKIDEGVRKYANVETNKALKIIADEARGFLKDLGVTTLPAKTMNSNTKPAASPGSGVNVPRPKPDDKPLNFVQQMKSMKSKRHSR